MSIAVLVNSIRKKRISAKSDKPVMSYLLGLLPGGGLHAADLLLGDHLCHRHVLLIADTNQGN